MLHLVLPVGISFYTFKAMSYAIDVYRGDARPMRRFTDYMCFEAFFPDLVAGPIIRYAALEEQMRVRDAHAREIRARRRVLRVRHGQEDPHRQPDGAHRRHRFRGRSAALATTPGSAWSATRFRSTSTSPATRTWRSGLALMLGFVLMQNFDSPYKSDSITEFWRRWHISLSTWLRDYLYIPLGGNRSRHAAHLRQPDARHAARRLVARRELELRHLGRHPRRRCWRAERAQGKDSAYRRLPRRAAGGHHVRDRVPVVGLLPRQDACSRRRLPRRDCSASRRPTAAADAVAGAIYTPYHGAMFVARRVSSSGAAEHLGVHRASLSPARARRRLALLGLAVAMMWTQTINPFLYFQF